MSQHHIPTIGIVLGMGGPAITGKPFFAVDPYSKVFIITDGKRAPHTAEIDDYSDHVKAIIAADSVVNFHRDELATLEREIERITVEYEIITGQLRLADVDPALIPVPENREEDLRRVTQLHDGAEQMHQQLIIGLFGLVDAFEQAVEARLSYETKIDEQAATIRQMKEDPTLGNTYIHADCLLRIAQVPGMLAWLESPNSGFTLPIDYSLTQAWVDEATQGYQHFLSQQTPSDEASEPAERMLCMERLLDPDSWGFLRWLKGPNGPGVPNLETVTIAQLDGLFAQYQQYEQTMNPGAGHQSAMGSLLSAHGQSLSAGEPAVIDDDGPTARDQGVTVNDDGGVHTIYSADDERRHIEEAQGMTHGSGSPLSAERHDPGLAHRDVPGTVAAPIPEVDSGLVGDVTGAHLAASGVGQD